MVSVLSTAVEVASGVTNASLVAVGIAVSVGITSVTNDPSAVGVAEGAVIGAKDTPLSAVGVKYCPHSDASPTQEDMRKETAINRIEMRFTIRPLEELYLS